MRNFSIGEVVTDGVSGACWTAGLAHLASLRLVRDRVRKAQPQGRVIPKKDMTVVLWLPHTQNI